MVDHAQNASPLPGIVREHQFNGGSLLGKPQGILHQVGDHLAYFVFFGVEGNR